jgi:hypothetical protein
VAAAGTEPTPVVEAASAVAATHLYVATTGSDSNAGTQSAPLKTIVKASQVAKPGTVVHVASGTYPGGIKTTASGTAAARITYVSDIRGGAKIVPPASSTSVFAWQNTGNYIDIVGFEVDGSKYQSGQKWWTGIYTTGSYSLIKYNHVHHFATTADTCTSNGGSGINSDNYYGAVNNDIIGNVVHHIGLASCNAIHGIYVVASGNVKNNVVYQIGAAGIHSWHNASNITIANNTVSGANYGILVGGNTPDKFNVSNNIVVGTVQGILENTSSGNYGINTFTNNLVYQNSLHDYNLRNTYSGSIHADPQFNNASIGDFRLKSTSPALNKASAVYAPSTDLVGTPRPTGAGIDIGAIEYKG